MSENKGIIEQFIHELDYPIFGIGVVVAAIGIATMVLWQKASGEFMSSVNSFLWNNFAWAYLAIVLFLVLFIIYLILGPWGRVKLGREDEDPEYSFKAYFAMLYSAGMASGVVFYGPSETLYHYQTPSPFFGPEALTAAAEAPAMIMTFFHWGISAWTVYLATALPIAFYCYRHGAPMRISTIMAPWVGLDNLDSLKAKTLDILAVLGTIGGVATTLGLIGTQFLTGLDYVFGIELGDLGTIIVITGLTIAFTTSVALGVNRGIRRISHFNMVLFFVLMVSVFVLGPTAYIFNLGAEAMGGYVNHFLELSMYTNIANAEPTWWVGSWTIFYWAWWMSWAPFVGLFVARISRGRTIWEVAFTGVFAATGATMPWFLALGGSAMFMQKTGGADILATMGEYGIPGAGFRLFEAFPAGTILMTMFMVLITTFFITSADSSTLSLAMLTTGGKERPSTINRIVWGGLMGAIASMLMVIGGVSAVKSAAIILGTPFMIVIVIGIWSLTKTLRHQHSVFTSPSSDLAIPTTPSRGMPADDEAVPTDDD